MRSLYPLLLAALSACVGAAPDASPDAGAATDAIDGAPADAGAALADAAPLPSPDAGAGADLLADEPGCFFTATAAGPGYERVVGEPGASYRKLTIDYRVVHGGWREDLFDRPVLNHNLMGLRRNVPDFVGRYILGNAARMKPAATGYDRSSLLYGRVDLEPRPAGEGYTGYTSWRTPFAWRPGQTYQVRITLNAIAGKQRLEVTAADGTTATTTGDIPYFEPWLSAATYTLELGGEDSDGREVRAVGWRFCDLRIEAVRE